MAMLPPIIPPVPVPVPSTDDPDNFDPRGDALLGWFPGGAAAIQGVGDAAYANALEVAAKTDQVAANAAIASAAANYKGLWSAQTGAANVPYSVKHNGRYWMLNTNIPNVALKEPGVATEWDSIDTRLGRRMVAGGTLVISQDDINSLLVFTGASAATWTLPTALTFGEGETRLQNGGTAPLTLARSSTDLIDGLPGYIMYPGEVRDFYSNGLDAYTSVVIKPFSRTITANETFTYPPGYQGLEGEGWGGGGGGGRTSVEVGCGGGGSAGAPFLIRAAEYTAGASVSLTIGAGGTGATATATAGGNGGNSTWGALKTFFGAGGGGNGFANGGASSGVLSAAVTTTGGQPVITSGNGDGFGGLSGGSGAGKNNAYGGGSGGEANSSTVGSVGGSSWWGGGAGAGGGVAGPAPAGGTSVYGGAGGAGGTNTLAGQDGQAPGGGGGGGGQTAGAGGKAGNGARGEIRVRGRI